MTTGPQLFRINNESRESHRVKEVDFVTHIGELRNRLRENPDVLSSVSVEGEALNESFASEIAARLTTMIESITPIVDEFEDENNEEDA